MNLWCGIGPPRVDERPRVEVGSRGGRGNSIQPPSFLNMLNISTFNKFIGAANRSHQQLCVWFAAQNEYAKHQARWNESAKGVKKPTHPPTRLLWAGRYGRALPGTRLWTNKKPNGTDSITGASFRTSRPSGSTDTKPRPATNETRPFLS